MTRSISAPARVLEVVANCLTVLVALVALVYIGTQRRNTPPVHPGWSLGAKAPTSGKLTYSGANQSLVLFGVAERDRCIR